MGMMRRKMPPRLAQGQAGVYSVAAQLLLHGIIPCFPAVDVGADLYTEMGTRIQVKCAHRRYGNSYHFCLVHGPSSNNRPYEERLCDSVHRDSDFYVLWGIDDNRYWIAPSAMFEGRTAAVMPPRDAAYLRVDELAVMADYHSGMKQADIARKHGLSKHVVCDVVNGNRSSGFDERIRFTKELLGYEGRWDLIVNAEAQRSSPRADASAEVAQLEQLLNK
jgi:hypothetical protein